MTNPHHQKYITTRHILTPCCVKAARRSVIWWCAGATCIIKRRNAWLEIPVAQQPPLWPLRRVQRWSSLAELLLPASSLTRNTRNTRHPPQVGFCFSHHHPGRRRSSFFTPLQRGEGCRDRLNTDQAAVGRENSTKIPSPRMDPAGRPTDPGRRN